MPGCVTLLLIVVKFCTYTDANVPSKKPCSRAPPGFIHTAPRPGTAGGGHGGVSVRFSRCVGLSGTSRGIVVSPPRGRTPRIGMDKRQILIRFFSALHRGAACAVSFNSTVISGGRSGPLNGFTCTFSANRRVSAVRMSNAILTTRGLRPMGNVRMKLRGGLRSDTFMGLPFSHVSHASDHKHFAVHKITPKGCHVCTLVSNGRGCFFSSGARTITFLSSLIIPSVHPTVHRSAM